MTDDAEVCRYCLEPLEPCTHNPPPGARHCDSKITGFRYCTVRRGKEHDPVDPGVWSRRQAPGSTATIPKRQETP